MKTRNKMSYLLLFLCMRYHYKSVNTHNPIAMNAIGLLQAVSGDMMRNIFVLKTAWRNTYLN